MKYLFGPVYSRRLGKSLGVDILPYKTCSLDCIYCECGCSTDLTIKRGEYLPTDEIIQEIDQYLAQSPDLDYVTFSGSGEPTLHTGIGQIISFIKSKYKQYKVAVLTNGTLLWDEKVRADISDADLVVPSLDGATEKSFGEICRPADGIGLDRIIEGLITFVKGFKGIVILEVFIVPGINDTDSELEALRNVCLRINPDIVQLNYLARPGCVDWIKIPSLTELERIKEFLYPLPVQIVKNDKSDNTDTVVVSDSPEKDILRLLDHRSATLSDIALMTGLRKGDIAKIVQRLVSEHKAEKKIINGEEYFLKNIMQAEP
jgi:wyosine [tRNA(Phe)-imidazoG37] synthetase (radical SAM superfamily)